LLGACGEPSGCGPARARVRRVLDGDTIELASGERVRYLLVDTPETTSGNNECYGPEAREFNRSLVENREVVLRYEDPCRDRYDRLLAYVSVEDREVNTHLVEQGYACVLHIPPNGDGRAREFQALEARARRSGRGIWRCEANPCR
jgi:micrococcal nuclease